MGNCTSKRKNELMEMRKSLSFTNDSTMKLWGSGGHNLWDGEDIISNLTEDVLLLILSLLDIKVAVRTSILSRRWRYLWTSLHVLNFDQRFYPWFKTYPFTNSLDKVITVLPNAQGIHLKLSIKLPQCLFTWKSIRVLKLKGIDGFLWLRNPHTVDLPALKALHLTRAFLDIELFDEFLSKCLLLEVLSLKCVEFTHIVGLNISSPRLKKLVIVAFHKNYSCSKYYAVKIFAPKLTYFKCRDYITKPYSLDSLSALVSAEIDLRINEHNVPLYTKEEYGKQVINFLEGLHCAESLTLSALALELFSSDWVKLQCEPTQFSNLCHFRLTISPNDACCLIIPLLKVSPNIKTLLLEITWTNFNSFQGRLHCDEPSFHSRIMEANWEEEMQFQCMLDHLVSIEIRNFLGCENEFKLLKVLVKRATTLNKVKIVLAQVWPHSTEKMMWIVWKILQKVPRASSNIILEFGNSIVLKL